MSNSAETTSHARLHSIAVVLASLIIPAPILAGKIAETIMKSTNPAGLDQLDVPLAYLTQILVSAFAVLACVLIAFLIAVLLLVRRAGSFGSAALPLTVAIIQGVIGIVSLILGGVISGLEG